MGSKTIYTKPASAWVEAMPLGNGSLGAMVFFGTDSERIALNHDTLWSGTPKDYARSTRKGAKESFERARALALEGRLSDAEKEIEGNFLDFNGEKYLPLGDLRLDFGHKRVTDYRRELDFETATASVSYKNSGKGYTRSAFVSHPHDALIYRIDGEGKRSVGFTLGFESKLTGTAKYEDGVLIYDGFCPGYAASEAVADNRFEDRHGIYTKGVSFRSAVRVTTVGGSVEVGDGRITVKGADSAVIYFVTKTNFVSPFVYPELGGKEYKNAALECLSRVSEENFDKAYRKHVRDFSSLYNRVHLDLGTSGKDGMPTDERLIGFAKDGNDLSLYTLLFDFARYLTISGSRKGTRAMNLQGIWNDRMPAPWRCNYTVNINTQMNYWPCLPFGLFECHEPLVNLLKTVARTGREVARRYYGARGFVVHHNVDLWGHASPAPWMAQWGYWQGGSGWLSRHLFEQYEYTLDKSFLKNTAYPIIKQAAIFYMDILTGADGALAIVPGTSPENSFLDKTGSRSAVAKYSTMMNCIAKETIENAARCCEILGVDEDFARSARETASKIVPLAKGRDGRLLEWDDEYAECEKNHRHVSHLYALHPADMITNKTPELLEAARRTLEARGDDGTGWSLGWKVNFYARLGDGNRALKLMNKQLSFVPSSVESIGVHGGGTYANLFDAHPPFQIDGNFGFASGVFEMLARVIGDELYLLPALPDEWRDGSIEGMRIKGGNILSLVWRDGELVSYELCGKKPLRVYCKGELISDLEDFI